MEESPSWLAPTWQADAQRWIADCGLTAHGTPDQVRLRPWSAMFRLTTGDGPVWFKANNPHSSYEPALLEALAHWAPGLTLTPIAVNAARGWSLTPDAGSTLREVQAGVTDLSHWTRILPRYAAMQREITAFVDDLLRLGVPDNRPAAMPGQLHRLLHDPAVRGDLDPGLGDGDLTRLRDLEAEYARWCAELDATGIEPSIQHDDLHDANVFISAGAYSIFDWGDASVAHPFGTMLVTMRSIAYRLDQPSTPDLTHLRDAYLEPWTDAYSHAELAAMVQLASRVGIVGRALSWQRALVDVPLVQRGEFADGPGGWLTELLEAGES